MSGKGKSGRGVINKYVKSLGKHDSKQKQDDKKYSTIRMPFVFHLAFDQLNGWVFDAVLIK